MKTNLEKFPCQLMGKGPRGSFFASDDKAENHINEGGGEKILRRKMKWRREENNHGPGLFLPFFEGKIPGPRLEKRKKQGLHY